MNKTNCPFCRSKETVERVTHEEVYEYKGYALHFDGYSFSRCENCGEEFETAAENKEIEKKMIIFQRQVDGLLTPDEIKSGRTFLGFTQTGLAEILSIGVKNFARWEAGTVTQSRAMDSLMRALFQYPELIMPIVSKKGHISSNVTKVSFACRVGASLEKKTNIDQRIIMHAEAI